VIDNVNQSLSVWCKCWQPFRISITRELSRAVGSLHPDFVTVGPDFPIPSSSCLEEESHTRDPKNEHQITPLAVLITSNPESMMVPNGRMREKATRPSDSDGDWSWLVA
jgi:hypothetical protein